MQIESTAVAPVPVGEIWDLNPDKTVVSNALIVILKISYS
jgi:hypothetical protein